MSHTSSLERQVSSIVDKLCYFPGRKGISVQTKRYPRFLPSENGVGFEQREWSFKYPDHPKDVPIPADAEDVIVTWRGASGISTEMRAALSETVSELSADGVTWDYQMYTRRNGGTEPDLVVTVFRSFASSMA
jgi:hypothetical protein